VVHFSAWRLSRQDGQTGACGAISLRRHYPDQVMGVAPRASQPSVNPLLQQGHDLSSLAHPAGSL